MILQIEEKFQALFGRFGANIFFFGCKMFEF